MPTVLVPVKLDAFVFNRAVCDGAPDEAKIAPITQPNYTFLRIDDYVAQNDVLPHVDLHLSVPPETNPRLTNLGTGEMRRTGVYLHWMLPRAYRSGVSTTGSAEERRDKDDFRKFATPVEVKAAVGSNTADYSAPQFPPVPTRWMVIRCINRTTMEPSEAPIPEVQAWVVESDRVNNIDDFPAEVDLEVDVSPFIQPGSPEKIDIKHQAELFIGGKTDAETWAEDKKAERITPLTVLTSSNPLFADYQLHNSNVFSIADSFTYIVDSKTTKKKDKVHAQLTKATASYYVLGWHSEVEKDILNVSTDKLEDRLKTCLMTLADNIPIPQDEQGGSGRLLCHGAIYDVEWNANEKPKHVPADDYSRHLHGKSPIAVGTTPLDALLAFIQAHDTDDTKTSDKSSSLQKLEEQILRIQTLLIAQDDGVEAQREAGDMLNTHNYDRIECGTLFHIAGENEGKDEKQDKPSPPTDAELVGLEELNQAQYALDLSTRLARKLQWDMFSLWWKYVSDEANSNRETSKENRNTVAALSKRLDDLQERIKDLGEKVQRLQLDFPRAKPAALPNAFQMRDPTLLISGIKSGWPHDYLEKLRVRLQSQIATGGSSGRLPPENWGTFTDGIAAKLQTLKGAAKALMQEFVLLAPGGTGKAKSGEALPLYHDPDITASLPSTPDLPSSADSSLPKTEDGQRLLRDQWGNTQPWFPLFLEWEVEYTHIPYDCWTLEERPSTTGSQMPKLRYGIKDDIDLAKEFHEDWRRFSGRSLILPQPSFSLLARVKQLFDTTPLTTLNEIIDGAEREIMLKNMNLLAFMSSPLAGFTDHLLTLVQGTHIKPNVRQPGEIPKPMEQAIAVGEKAGFREHELKLIGQESDLTPYGTMVMQLNKRSIFKPVTHGQFKFTKLNIIDKFGQAIHAYDPITPTAPPDPAIPPLTPCVSEYYACQPIRGHPTIANTVGGTPTTDSALSEHCEYVQLPPHINQFARLNHHFVIYDEKQRYAYWRPVGEWEKTNPIWGWVVVNSVDNGIQLFLADGTFYRAVRRGGPDGAATSPAWLPFEPPDIPDYSAANLKQLGHLVARLLDPVFLQQFIDMINEAARNSAPAPTAYAQFVNSVVGKPLALVNMGWSLELAVDAYTNQSTLDKGRAEHRLLPRENADFYTSCLNLDKEKVHEELLGYTRQLATENDGCYNFHLKFGDKDRVYDGLVGYFRAAEHPTQGNELDLSKFYTYQEAAPPVEVSNSQNPPPLNVIGPANYPVFRAYWVPPDDKTPAQIRALRNAQLQVFGALLDPFTPVHAYSSFLPTTALQLPPFTWQSAMEKMTAFFHLGPLLVPAGVPQYKENSQLGETTEDKPAAGSIPIPALAFAEWRWLQPYLDKGKKVFVPLAIETLDARPRFEETPYTAIEGYLQLQKPIGRFQGIPE